MAQPVSARRQHTKDRLVAAAIELFAKKSIEAVSVEEICERTGFTRGAFYSNFESREDLCLEIVRQNGEQALAATHRAFALIPDELATDTVAEVITKVVAALDLGMNQDDQWVLVHTELRHYAFRNPRFGPDFLEAERRTMTLAADSLAEALKRRGVSFRIPLPQFIQTLDAFCERTRLDAILAGQQHDSNPWREGMERLVQALVVLPEGK